MRNQGQATYVERVEYVFRLAYSDRRKPLVQVGRRPISTKYLTLDTLSQGPRQASNDFKTRSMLSISVRWLSNCFNVDVVAIISRVRGVTRTLL